ncbi:MAG: DUF488 domain-containing protein [Armatimonadetes bacterium]|nr:DUF488 domain-containing protein [Armatimonadota bacterium]
MRLLTRQKVLLELMVAVGGRIGKTDLQKLLFLFTHEWEDSPSYDFVPYKFGCFSFTSNADLLKLEFRGLVRENESGWILTRAGKACAEESLLADAFATEHSDLRGDALIECVYSRYPEIAWRSEILGSIVKDKKTLSKIRRSRPKGHGPGLSTIGYEGRSLEEYLNLLLADCVTILCDVRRNPISRRYGFSKGVLSSCCENIGVKYEHLPELGIASSERRNLNSQSDYDRLFRKYERKMLPVQTGHVSRIADWINSGERVALTCFELDPVQCHRSSVAGAVVARMDSGQIVTNL